MTTPFKMLVLTDHLTHTKENSIYPLVRALLKHQSCRQIDLASRGNSQNNAFFHQEMTDLLWVSPAKANFRFTDDSRFFKPELKEVSIRDYDFVLLRLPHPVAPSFWTFLQKVYPDSQYLNRPSGIEKTSSKAFLMEVKELCPPMQVCHTLEEVKAFKKQFPIVLKPLRGFGGKGIVRIEGTTAWLGAEQVPLEHFFNTLQKEDFPLLAMQYLKNVSQGDKRVVVVGGEILGASLRIPAKDSWLCNVSQGGHSTATAVTKEEKEMARRLTEILSPLGIQFYGFDTLVDDQGKRVLSEINTMSVGGLPQIEAQSGQPVLSTSADLIWNEVNKLK
jgi:glutathione synthase